MCDDILYASDTIVCHDKQFPYSEHHVCFETITDANNSWQTMMGYERQGINHSHSLWAHYRDRSNLIARSDGKGNVQYVDWLKTPPEFI